MSGALIFPYTATFGVPLKRGEDKSQNDERLEEKRHGKSRRDSFTVSRKFITLFYQDADRLTEAINDWVRESDEVIAPLREANFLTSEPFDEPVDFVHFDLWPHWGRTAKFGAWMQGPDYVQWHGAYEILQEMAELRDIVQKKLCQHRAAEGGQ